mmetsp:Transcript_59283/g.97946  ORF Transcript_59283/g.97946 Transcript_59283/m.97946 type:complete len:85 (+) Transcript_59283:41-295(+)
MSYYYMIKQMDWHSQRSVSDHSNEKQDEEQQKNQKKTFRIHFNWVDRCRDWLKTQVFENQEFHTQPDAFQSTEYWAMLWQIEDY